MNKSEYTEVGELLDTPEYGLVIRLTFGTTLKRIFKAAGLFDKRLEVSMKVLKHQRSLASNRYLWGVCYTTICAFLKETQGEKVDKDAIHIHTLTVILERKPQVQNILGKEVITFNEKSTSKLTTEEFTDMIAKLKDYWAERGCFIPEARGNNFMSDYLEDD